MIRYNKLVRDKIPDIIKESGKTPIYKVLNDEEYKLALKDKLLEEVNEFIEAETHADIIEELVDIMSVIQTIVLVYEIDPNSYNLVYNNKLLTKGGFNNRYFLESVEE